MVLKQNNFYTSVHHFRSLPITPHRSRREANHDSRFRHAGTKETATALYQSLLFVCILGLEANSWSTNHNNMSSALYLCKAQFACIPVLWMLAANNRLLVFHLFLEETIEGSDKNMKPKHPTAAAAFSHQSVEHLHAYNYILFMNLCLYCISLLYVFVSS